MKLIFFLTLHILLFSISSMSTEFCSDQNKTSSAVMNVLKQIITADMEIGGSEIRDFKENILVDKNLLVEKIFLSFYHPSDDMNIQKNAFQDIHDRCSNIAEDNLYSNCLSSFFQIYDSAMFLILDLTMISQCYKLEETKIIHFTELLDSMIHGYESRIISYLSDLRKNNQIPSNKQYLDTCNLLVQKVVFLENQINLLNSFSKNGTGMNLSRQYLDQMTMTRDLMKILCSSI